MLTIEMELDDVVLVRAGLGKIREYYQDKNRQHPEDCVRQRNNDLIKKVNELSARIIIEYDNYQKKKEEEDHGHNGEHRHRRPAYGQRSKRNLRR